MIRTFVKDVPVPTAGLALGVVATGKLTGPYIPGIEAVCAAISAILIALVTIKALVCRKALAADLHQPVQASGFRNILYDLHAIIHVPSNTFGSYWPYCLVCCCNRSICIDDLVYQRTYS